jgi:diguanylate cyclase (GGDEF)-like protein
MALGGNIMEPDQQVGLPNVGHIAHMGVITAKPQTTIESAIKLMLKHGSRNIIFEKKTIHYIFTTDDLFNHVEKSDDFSTALDTLPLQELRKINESENVIDVLMFFDNDYNRYIGVYNQQNDLIGILSYSDVLSAVDPGTFIAKKTGGSLLCSQHCLSVTADRSTKDILYYLRDVENAVIVVEDSKPIGILTAEDMLRIFRNKWDINQAVEQYMHSPVDTLNQSKSICDILTYLQETNYKRAVIVDDANRLLGTLTQSDLAGFAFSHWSEAVRTHTQELSDEVSVFKNRTKALERDAYIDPLTLIGNRRSFNQQSERELQRVLRYNAKAFSLMIIDIDFFKKVNDTYGHLKGDDVLKSLVVMIKKLIRTTDVFCRWGGEEFILLLPETSLASAQILAERIRQCIAQDFTHGFSFTVSAGVGQYQQGESMEALIRRVDAALYCAKGSGRNRVELSQMDTQVVCN